MAIKLIAIDMDGTLLNSEHVIPEENKQAIKDAEAKGVHVVISTCLLYTSRAHETL
ncbi:HAD hydrolase family protein, partial [Bacillus pumilus]